MATTTNRSSALDDTSCSNYFDTTVVMVLRGRRYGIVVSTGGPHRPPKAYVFNIEHNYAGVKWKVLYGKASPYRDAESYAFCHINPYCPKCDYEMQAEMSGWIFKRYYWKCDRCGRFYKCPTRSFYDAHEVVERLVEADVRSWRFKLE